MAFERNTVRKSNWLAWILLSVGLVATIAATIYVKTDVEADAKREFDFACSQVQLRIDARMEAHARILTSAAALFHASDAVTREEWHTYTRQQKVEQHLPGIQGIGFSLVIPRERLEQHIQEVRSQGFPDYNVKPEGDRETYTSIIYLEPFSGRNLRAFGYDMFSEPVRRTAMERARDLDMAVLSGKVTLVQETDQDVQAGILMYVPVYRKGMPADTVADRRDALFGWVYSPYRMQDLMQGILRGWDLEAGKRIRLQIFDTELLSADSLLYDSQPKGEMETVNASRLTLETHTNLNDHFWSLRFRFTRTDGQLAFGRVYGVFFSGTSISLLLFGLLFSLLNTRFRALLLADQLTMDLRENEEKYRIIFNNEIYAICIFDLETLRLLDVNGAYCRLYGYSREELISGMTIHDITAEHHVSDAATRQALREGTIFIPLRYHRKKDGTVFSVEIVGGPYEWKGQTVMYALAHDITDRKRIEQENAKLETQNRQLQKSESLCRMAGAIAHHFNNQLQVVMGNLEMAMDDLPAGSGTLETLAEAMKGARKATEVSGLMLAYRGQTPGKHETMDLSETCRSSLTLLRAAAPKGMIFSADFPAAGPVIRGNADQIQQVLTNLITNAWESISDNRGTIALTVKTVSHADIPAPKRFPIDWRPQEIAHACLEVSDTGCGISNKDIEKLFDPFFTTKFYGRGMGLSVVLGIAGAHGGGVTVDSEPGRGSVFRIFLPVSTEELPCRHDLPAAPKVIPTGKVEKTSKVEGGGTVLLIEDEEQVRKMAKIMLTRLGYSVLEAKDGIEAVEIFQLHQDEIRCVLSDLTMPRMDGWETLAALRNLSPDIPVILSSGYDEALVMAGEHPERPNAFLGKPYKANDLRDAIQKAIGRSNTLRQDRRNKEEVTSWHPEKKPV